MSDINKLRRLAQAATPGPWYVGTGTYEGCNIYSVVSVTDAEGFTYQPVVATAEDNEVPQWDANVRLIAACNPVAISELLDRLEAAEKAVTEAYQRGYATGQEEIEKERDALRTLVVMRCDLDYLPQFTQGHESHEFTEPVTAEHCRWFVAEIERLRTDCDALRDKIERMEQPESGFRERCTPAAPAGGSNRFPLYALPGAKGEEK